MTRLLAKPWLTPLLHLVAEKGGCIEKKGIALEPLKKKTVKTLVWSLIEAGLATRKDEEICLTDIGESEARKLRQVAARGTLRLYSYGDNILVLVKLKPTRITAYVVQKSLVEKTLELKPASHRELAKKLNIHPKTASIALRAAKLLQEPNAYNPRPRTSP